MLGPERMEFALSDLDGDAYTHTSCHPSFRSSVAFDVANETAASVAIGEFDVGGRGTLERV